jgi:hypothetical protein
MFNCCGFNAYQLFNIRELEVSGVHIAFFEFSVDYIT